MLEGHNTQAAGEIRTPGRPPTKRLHRPSVLQRRNWAVGNRQSAVDSEPIGLPVHIARLLMLLTANDCPIQTRRARDSNPTPEGAYCLANSPPDPQTLTLHKLRTESKPRPADHRKEGGGIEPRALKGRPRFRDEFRSRPVTFRKSETFTTNTGSTGLEPAVLSSTGRCISHYATTPKPPRTPPRR